MLDTIVVRQAPAYPQTVHQHLAPTAEHAALLRDFERAAEARILERLDVAANELRCTFVRWTEMGRPRVRCLLKINGVAHSIDLDAGDSIAATIQDRVEEIRRFVAEALALHVVGTELLMAQEARRG